MRGSIATAVLGSLVLVAALACLARTSWLEGRELRVIERASIDELASREDATPESVRLARVRLVRDQVVTFQLCADDPMQPERWAGAMAVAIWRPRARELMTRTELTDEVLAQVRRNATHGCLTIGGGVVAESDDYAVEALWDERPATIASVPLTLSVEARHPLELVDLVLVLLAWAGALAMVAVLALRPATRAASARGRGQLGGGDPDAAASEIDLWEAEQAAHARSWPPEVRAVAGVTLVALGFAVTSFLPAGATWALGTAIVLHGFNVAVAFGLAGGPGARRRLEVLALARPLRAWLYFPLAFVGGFVLWLAAIQATALVPSTSESAIQVFVSMPSGLLSFASLAVVAPLAEEIFFRGFLYGVLEQRSRVVAFAVSALLFVAAHGYQTWGQWGALVAIGVTGVSLTALRAASRSTLVPALAHLVYNGLLAIGALA